MDDSPIDVLVAGGGVAGLETLLALRDLAGDRVRLTLLTPEDDFVYRPTAVGHPFGRGHAQRHRLAEITGDLGARLVRGSLARVDDPARKVHTAEGEELSYDALLVAVGAKAEPAVEGALVWTPERDPEVYGGLLRDLEEGYTKRLAFVVPRDVAWPLPAYELALMTAWAAREASRRDVQITIHTPEEAPLAIFGSAASDAVAAELADLGIEVRTGVEIHHAREAHANRVVALPCAVGPGVEGLPADERGFIAVDPHGKVTGAETAWAAGDVTAFHIKQGGLAAQQADAAAEAIAKAAGADVDPAPFHPVLRGVLLTGRGEAWLRHDLEEGADEGESSRRALFWPPTKIAGRYLAPYLAARDAGDAAPASAPDGYAVILDLGEDEGAAGEVAGGTAG